MARRSSIRTWIRWASKRGRNSAATMRLSIASTPCGRAANLSRHQFDSRRPRKLAATNGNRVVALFNFVKKLRTDSQSAGIYGSQKREDYDRDDVEHYFNYTGMLAVEGTYDRLNQLLESGVEPVDLLLLMACAEGDKPKIEELLMAGARADVKNPDGLTAVEVAKNDEVKEILANRPSTS